MDPRRSILPGCALLILLLLPRTVHAGDWMPVTGCESVASDPDSISMTVYLWDHLDNIPSCRVTILPEAQAGYEPVPFTLSISAPGWSVAWDDTLGGYVVLGCTDFSGFSPPLTLRSSSRHVPVRADFYNAAGQDIKPFPGVLSCAEGTPTRPMTFGQLKAIYR